MKAKLTILALLAFLGHSISFAQETPPTDTIEQEQVTEAPAQPAETPPPTQEAPPQQKKSAKDKIYFGGYVNMSFGNYTIIGIEPMIGYKLIPRLSIGAKIRYDYIQDKRFDETYTSSSYGASIFSRLVLVRGLYAHVEYAGYNYKRYIESGESEREWVPFLLVGAGYTLRVGKRASVNAQVLFDVLQDNQSPYKNWEPFYSVGVGVGF
jgi:hypothetical protein